MTSAAHAHQFFTLRNRADICLAQARFWRALALRCAKAKAQAERDAGDLMEAAIRAGAAYVVERSREESRAHAHRLADVLAWLDSAELEQQEAATVARLAEERAT